MRFFYCTTERRLIQFADILCRRIGTACFAMNIENFTPIDNCIHGKYCGRFGVFITTVPHKYESLHVSVEVPAGTQTDFASVPWPFTNLFPNVGPYARAALFHDQLYRQQTCSRATADAIFLHIMQRDHTPVWQRWPIYWAVRAFGGIYWRRQAERNKDRSQP